jgi:hypothetical protein
VLIANYGRCIADSHELAAPRKSAESSQARTYTVLCPFRFIKPLSSICSRSIEGLGARTMSGLPGRRTSKLIRRRHFIAGAGATVMAALAGSHSAKTQVDAPRSPATPFIRPASMILKNGRIITVDPASTIA